MPKDKTYDPFDSFKKISGMWEKQLNGLLYMMTDNNEFVRIMKTTTESHARYMELLRKNQDLMAGFMNIPTKKDVANVAKLSIQAEEKIDILEEQIWNLQDGLKALNKENLEMFQEMVKQLTSEFQKIAKEISIAQKIKAELKEIRQGMADLSELKQEIAQLSDIKLELAALKELIEEEMGKELLLT